MSNIRIKCNFKHVFLLLVFISNIAKAQCNCIVLVGYDSTYIHSHSNHNLTVIFNNFQQNTYDFLLNNRKMPKGPNNMGGANKTEFIFKIKHVQQGKMYVLKAKDILSNKCLEIVLDTRYEFVRISKAVQNDDAEWYVNYSNKVIAIE